MLSDSITFLYPPSKFKGNHNFPRDQLIGRPLFTDPPGYRPDPPGSGMIPLASYGPDLLAPVWSPWLRAWSPWLVLRAWSPWLRVWFPWLRPDPLATGLKLISLATGLIPMATGLNPWLRPEPLATGMIPLTSDYGSNTSVLWLPAWSPGYGPLVNGFAKSSAIIFSLSRWFFCISIEYEERQHESIRFDELNPINTSKSNFVGQNQKI